MAHSSHGLKAGDFCASIKRRQFFKLFKEYSQNPETFSIQYKRAEPTRTIEPKREKNIIKELKIAKEFIDNKQMPIWPYNYSFIKNDIEKLYKQKVSLSTIINKSR